MNKIQTQTESAPQKDTQKNLHQWRETAAAQGLRGEWAVAARLGVPAFSEEEMEAVANLFGR